MPIPNIHSKHPLCFGDAAADDLYPAAAAAVLVILGVSASIVQEYVHFLAAVMAVMARLLLDHSGTVIQALPQNLIWKSCKQDWKNFFWGGNLQCRRVFSKSACSASTAY